MSQAWTEKYRPKTLSEVIGHETHIANMTSWIKEFKKNPKNTKKILLIGGPPGVGKTTIAHLLLKDHGYRVLEYNASDDRKGKTIKEVLKKTVGRYNVMDMMYGRQQSSGLILDEIDGLKGNDKDRGGLNELIKFVESKHGKTVYTPIICTYNPFSLKSLTKLKKLAVMINLKKPGKYHCKQLVERIVEAEKLPIAEDGVVQIVKHLMGDMRQIINALWLLNLETQNKEDYDEDSVKKFLKRAMQKDTDPQLYDSVRQVLRKPNLEIDQCIKMNSMDIQIPLLLHENYPQVIGSADDKFKIHQRVMDGIIEHDILQNTIFKNHDWSLSPYCAVVNLFSMNRHLADRKMTRQIKINSADSLNKIQLSKTNMKSINNIRYDLRITMTDEALTHLAELLCGLLFDRVKKKEMPNEDQLDKVLEILIQYKLTVDDITNIIKLNRYNSNNYSFGGKYKRHIIVHILRCRLRTESESIIPGVELTSDQIESLITIMCPYFTGKSKPKTRMAKIVKALLEYLPDELVTIKQLEDDMKNHVNDVEDALSELVGVLKKSYENKILKILRNDLIRN